MRVITFRSAGWGAGREGGTERTFSGLRKELSVHPEPGPEALKKRSEPSEVTPIQFNFTIATPNPDFNSKILLFSRSCFTAASDVSYLLLYILH